MIISLVLAWIASACVILTALKFIAKKNKTVNYFFHCIHIPLGITLIVAGVLHGLFAGNSTGTSLGQASIGAVLFSWNLGTVCLIISILLGITYVLRKRLRKNWIILHRILTIILVVVLILHISQTGISLPSVLFAKEEAVEMQEYTELNGNIEVVEEHPDNESIEEVAEDTDKEIAEEVIEDTDNETTEEVAADDYQVTFSGATLNDGTYEGSAEGYNGTIRVSVSVENGSVTDVSIVDNNDTPKFFESAKQIIDSIINSQSLEVDGVSGATYSSRGIRDAVYDALQDAVASGELQISDIQVSNNHGHGNHGM